MKQIFNYLNLSRSIILSKYFKDVSLCEIIIRVMFLLSFEIEFITSFSVSKSRALVGSSNIIIFASLYSALAIPILCL